ncbi:MAG: gliding motility-associated C-terminal domain-containing protein [Saprospiraceae bacterium]|nr:gliding motility-associated C-terminal domain-containing protein [Saprospiraceae bacterium]
MRITVQSALHSFFCLIFLLPSFGVKAESLAATPFLPKSAMDCFYWADSMLASRTLSDPDFKGAMVAPMFTVTPDLCGMGQGAINMTPDPNTPGPWVQLWSNGETTEDISGLTAGSYQVTIIDANGVPQIGQVIVGDLPPIGPTLIDGVVTGNTLCTGSSNGAIDLTVEPFPNSWSYEWSNGETTQDLVDIPPGDYSVSITWGVTCTTVVDYTVPNLTNAPGLIPPLGGFPPDFCNQSNGSALIQAVGGVQPYTYEWSNGGTDLQILNLTAGEYTVTVTGANGCTATYSSEVPAMDLPIIVVEDYENPSTTCIGGNGSIGISLSPSGLWQNTATYLWSNGATTQDISNLTPGTYVVTVTRAGTCTDLAVFFIDDEPVLPALSFTPSSASCGMNNGGVNMTPLPGGVPPYTYLWSNMATTEDLTNVPGGNYSVTLTSANGCTTSGSVDVEDNQAIFSYSATIQDNTSCDTINGRISLSLFPANLAYTWSNGATTTNQSPLAPGDYTVTISAGGTCTAVETFNVGNQVEYPSIPALVDTATCGLNNGGIDMSINGGASPFAIMWSTGDTSQDLTKLTADTFFVTVTTAVGCSVTNTVIVPNVNQPIGIHEVVADNISCALPTGAIDLNVSPMDTSYVYTWSSGQTTDSLTNLTGGIYLVTVTLGVSCIALDTFSIIDQALPPNLATSTSAATCGFNNGSADLTVNVGAPPFTYLWSNAATDEDLVNMTPGTYTVTVTGVNMCTAVSTVNILNNTLPVGISGLPLENSSCATPNGSLDISINPAGAYTYAWSNAETTEDLSGLSAGTYTVTVTFGTCTGSNTFSIADNAVSPSLAVSGVASNCGLADGEVDLSVNAGVGPYTYVWSNTGTDEDLIGLTPGTYTVTVTGANACTEESTVVVTNNNITLNLNSNATSNSSCTAFNGALDLSVTPAGAYTYQWSNAGNTEDLSGLDAGNYTVTVTLGTCQSTGTYVVADNTQTPVLTPNITASICSVNNGAIDLNVSGPAGPYTYLWSNAVTDEDLTALLPGTYTVTVTANNGCTEISTINVPNNSNTFSVAGAAAPLTDCATNNGAINLNITPAGSYTYLWSNAATDEDLAGLAPGTYTVSVTESGSCTATASFFVIDQRTNPITAQALTPELCGQADGAIDLTVSGGATPYGYAWSNTSVTEDLNNLTAGIYTVTVTDANNCTATSSATIPGNTISFALSGNATANSSCVLNTGAVDLSVNPAGAYTFTWSNAEVTEDINNVSAGTYTVTVSAGGNCTNTAAFNITSNVPTPAISQTTTAAECGAADGAIDLSVSGSPMPYTYLWSNMAITEDLNGVLSGSYTVTVTAGNGCTSTQAITVPENVFAPAIASAPSPSSSCVVNNGSIDLTVTPIGTYTYLWSNTAITEDLNNIAAGIYTVTVSAGGACTSTAVITVGSNVPTPAIANAINNADCSAASGSIDLTITGSPAPYTFLWSNMAITEDLNNILSGAYTVTVTGGNGCTTSQTFTVQNDVFTPAITSNLTPSTSCVVNNGAVDLTVTPVGVYTYLWSTTAITEDLSNLAPGTYTVTVSAGGTCTSTASVTISANTPAPALSNVPTPAACGLAVGSIDLTVSGSQTPYTFQWSNSAITEDLANITGGTYTVTVTAGNGCTSTQSIVVQDITVAPSLASTVTPNNSCATGNGAIDLNVTPVGAYTFNWSNGAVTEDLSGLDPGTYTVTVSAGGACTGTVSVQIADQSTNPQANITSVGTALNCDITSIVLNGAVTGTNNPVNLQWSLNGNPLGSNATLTATAPGQYDFVVVDNVTACTATASITLTQSLNPPPISIANPALLTCVSPSQTLTGSSTLSGIQFSWATISGTDTTILGSGPTLNVNAAGNYILIGFNPANNCFNAVPVNVQADQTPPGADAGLSFTLDCAGETLPLNGSGSGAANLGYQWSTQDGHLVSGANTAAPLIDKAGTYTLTVTNLLNGCTATDNVIITPEVPVAHVSVIQPTCDNLKGSIVIDSVTGLSNPILYGLNGGGLSSQNQFINLDPGAYNIMVEGGNGCAATAVANINAADQVEISLDALAEIRMGYGYQINALVDIPLSDIASITWTPSDSLSCDTCLSTYATPTNTTQYHLHVVSEAGCEARGTIQIRVDNARNVYGPNIFSPNEDGNNDYFTLFADPVQVTRIKSLQIFSRWGEAIYERLDFAPNESLGWDGTYKGQKLNPAVFIWQAVVEFVDGQEELFTGDVTLKR